MNERIKQLAEQAELNATLLFNKNKLEKFAELIVRECAEVVNYYHTRNESVTPSQILQHFGVDL